MDGVEREPIHILGLLGVLIAFLAVLRLSWEASKNIMLGFHVSLPAILCQSFNVSRFQICKRSKTQLLLLRSHACPHTSIDDESCDEPAQPLQKRASTLFQK